MTAFFNFVILYFVALALSAQTTFPPEPLFEPEIGRPIEDYTFQHIENMPTNRVSISDYRGRWLFIDFWSSGCSANIANLTDIQRYHDALNDRMDFLVIVMNDRRDRGNEMHFPLLQERLKTHLPVAYDSILPYRWSVWSTPRHIIIDPQGVVQSYTDGEDLTVEKLRALIEGGSPSIRIYKKRSVRYIPPRYNDSRDNDVLYQSVLSEWKEERSGVVSLKRYAQNPESFPHGIHISGANAEMLFEFAYGTGTSIDVRRINGRIVYPNGIVETSEPDVFLSDTTGLVQRGRYNFSVKVDASRRRDTEYLRAISQRQMKSIFGYDVVIQQRSMPVWRLLAKPGAARALATKGGQESIDGNALSIRLRNASMQTLRDMVSSLLYLKGVPFLNENETGYDGNIDIELHG